MPLRECLKKTTNREYRTWMQWLTDDMNRPSRSDYYAMQIAAVMGGGDVNKLRIPFEPVIPTKGTRGGISKEHATAYAKAKWCGVTGFKKVGKTDGD